MKSHTLSLAEELPVSEIPDVVDWSENYAFVGYDFDSRIGFCAYINRWVKNPKIFREQLFLYLPDGSVLSHISMGTATTGQTFRAGCLCMHCAEPGGRWVISYEGPMRHDKLDGLLKEPVKEGNPHNVRFGVEIQHAAPVWMFPRAEGNASYGKFHYEQMGTCRGSFTFNGVDHAFAAPTYRDHTRGPRNLQNYDSHIWLQLHFPAGPSFSAYNMWHNDDGIVTKILDLGTSVRPGELTAATLDSSTRLTSLTDIGDRVCVQVTLEGRTVDLVGDPIATLIYSFTKDVEFLYGAVPSIAEFFSIEQPILFTGPDGPVQGYLQRSGSYPTPA